MNKYLKNFVSYSYLITCLLLYITFGNQFIVIEPCDKNRLISIINTKDYFTKSYIHLQDHNTYKSLSLRPTKAIAHDVHTLLHYMHSQHVIGEITM